MKQAENKHGHHHSCKNHSLCVDFTHHNSRQGFAVLYFIVVVAIMLLRLLGYLALLRAAVSVSDIKIVFKTNISQPNDLFISPK